MYSFDDTSRMFVFNYFGNNMCYGCGYGVMRALIINKYKFGRAILRHEWLVRSDTTTEEKTEGPITLLPNP